MIHPKRPEDRGPLSFNHKVDGAVLAEWVRGEPGVVWETGVVLHTLRQLVV